MTDANEDPFDLPVPNRKKRRAKKAAKRKKTKVTIRKKRESKIIIPKSAVPEENLKHFVAMARETVAPGRGRIFMCDGYYVAIRRNVVNPEALKRNDAMIANGEMEHALTLDDVQIFKLTDKSPLKRKRAVNMSESKFGQLMRDTAVAAVSRDWDSYVDGLQEVYCRYRASFDPGNAQLMFTEYMATLNAVIAMRGGPGEQERIYQKDLVMQKRGAGSRAIIAMPLEQKRLVRV